MISRLLWEFSKIPIKVLLAEDSKTYFHIAIAILNSVRRFIGDTIYVPMIYYFVYQTLLLNIPIYHEWLFKLFNTQYKFLINQLRTIISSTPQSKAAETRRTPSHDVQMPLLLIHIRQLASTCLGQGPQRGDG